MEAASFLALLRASNPAWHESDMDIPRWVFRGHRNAAWRLKPQAWRSHSEGNRLHAMIERLAEAEVRTSDGIDAKVPPGTNIRKALAWAHAEKLVLNEFRRIGWRMGFDVDEPNTSYSMDINYGPVIIDDTRQEPDSESPFFAANDVGIAQHYGVPTRFLDWTFNPIFAIFLLRRTTGQTLMKLTSVSGRWI